MHKYTHLFMDRGSHPKNIGFNNQFTLDTGMHIVPVPDICVITVCTFWCIRDGFCHFWCLCDGLFHFWCCSSTSFLLLVLSFLCRDVYYSSIWLQFHEITCTGLCWSGASWVLTTTFYFLARYMEVYDMNLWCKVLLISNLVLNCLFTNVTKNFTASNLIILCRGLRDLTY